MKVMPGFDSLSSPNGLHEAPLSTRPIVIETGPGRAVCDCRQKMRTCNYFLPRYITTRPGPGTHAVVWLLELSTELREISQIMEKTPTKIGFNIC